MKSSSVLTRIVTVIPHFITVKPLLTSKTHGCALVKGFCILVEYHLSRDLKSFINLLCFLYHPLHQNLIYLIILVFRYLRDGIHGKPFYVRNRVKAKCRHTCRWLSFVFPRASSMGLRMLWCRSKILSALQTVLNILKPQHILAGFRVLCPHGLVLRATFLVFFQEILSTKVV